MEEEVVNKKTEEGKKKNRTSLKSILGGDILATDFFRRQTKLLVLIMVFIIFYIHNRYASQQQQIEIDRLKKELIDIKYDALTRSSELMEKSRQSRIEDYISSKESDLQTSTNPPYLIIDKAERRLQISEEVGFCFSFYVARLHDVFHHAVFQ